MVFGKGYIGEGQYKSQVNGLRNPIYDIWHSMLERCYHANTKQRFPSYQKCEVCEEWLNFQNFAKWYEENIYLTPSNDKMCIDKDILIKHNKLYSPDTCCIVPNRINMLFTRVNKTRGKYPVGVSYDSRNGQYLSKCKSNGKTVFLGYYDNVETAFNVYKKFKEHEITNVAEEYKHYIPTKVYIALKNYCVEITD